jgi:hypothetical protein
VGRGGLSDELTGAGRCLDCAQHVFINLTFAEDGQHLHCRVAAERVLKLSSLVLGIGGPVALGIATSIWGETRRSWSAGDKSGTATIGCAWEVDHVDNAVAFGGRPPRWALLDGPMLAIYAVSFALACKTLQQWYKPSYCRTYKDASVGAAGSVEAPSLGDALLGARLSMRGQRRVQMADMALHELDSGGTRLIDTSGQQLPMLFAFLLCWGPRIGLVFHSKSILLRYAHVRRGCA